MKTKDNAMQTDKEMIQNAIDKLRDNGFHDEATLMALLWAERCGYKSAVDKFCLEAVNE